jgi:hypothetical protein
MDKKTKKKINTRAAVSIAGNGGKGCPSGPGGGPGLRSGKPALTLWFIISGGRR